MIDRLARFRPHVVAEILERDRPQRLGQPLMHAPKDRVRNPLGVSPSVSVPFLVGRAMAIPNALTRIEAELKPLPEVQHLVDFVRTSERGISK